MKVYVAEEAGFCFGVRRALEIIDDLHEKNQDTQIFGQLIHNRTVLENLKAKGIDCIDSFTELDANKKLVIRTHGIPVETEKDLEKRGVDYIDATCPLVKKLHKIAAEVYRQDKKNRFVIVGDRNHPEIEAALSYAPGTTVIASEEEARAVPHSENLAVIAQTTLDADRFERIVTILEGKTEHLSVYDTICNATITRQEAVKKLAPAVDVVLVVGGKNSSNTQKLYHIALARNKNTFHIESCDDLLADDSGLLRQVAQFRTVGITAGASTPPDEIEKIRKLLGSIHSNRVKEMNHGRRKRNPDH
jgi:4-hydroxy-3-methylbut-2-enyl diphosphate reductase